MEDSVTRSLSKLTIRSYSIGFSAALLALACGSEDNNNPPVEPPPVQVDRPDPCENPLNVECNDDTGSIIPKPPEMMQKPDEPKKETDQKDLERAAVENLLNSKCGYCHGPSLSSQDAQAGMNFIDDIDALVKAGKITPMNSA